MRARFFRSDAAIEAFGPNPAESFTDEYESLQLTYNELRGPNGDTLAHYDSPVGAWYFNGQAYSDVVLFTGAIVEGGSFAVTVTLKTTMEFAPIERRTPLGASDAIENAKGSVISDVWGELQDAGWTVNFDATRL